MIVAVGGDKGSPGASTLATALALTWPCECMLAELDPRGTDLPLRLHHASGGPILERPSIATLALDARPGGSRPALQDYTQPTSLGVPFIPGELSPRAGAQLTAHLPTIATVAAESPGVLIADLGALLPGNPALTFAKAAIVTLLTTRSTLEGLARLVERVETLIDLAGAPGRTSPPIGVVVVAEPADRKAAEERARRLLAGVGSPAPVLGSVPLDAKGVTQLYAKAPSKKLLRSALIRAAREISAGVCATWPELTRPGTDATRPVSGLSPHDPVGASVQDPSSGRGALHTPALDWPTVGGEQ